MFGIWKFTLIGIVMLTVMAIVTVVNPMVAIQTGQLHSVGAWHGSTSPSADCDGWNVAVNTVWVDSNGVGHPGTIIESSNLIGSWGNSTSSVNWYVKLGWPTGETWSDRGTVSKPDGCETEVTPEPTPEATLPPEQTPEPSGTPVVPTQPPATVETPKTWWACDDGAAPEGWHEAHCFEVPVTPEPVPIVYGPIDQFELHYGYIEDLEPGQLCDVYAGKDLVGSFTVIRKDIGSSNGVLSVYSEKYAAKASEWHAENCHDRAKVAPAKFVPTLPTQKCEGNCPPPVCLLGYDKVISTGFAHLGIHADGQPEWYETREAAEADGLTYVGEECSLCLTWAVNSKDQTVWFGPGATEADLAIAIQTVMDWDADHAAAAAHAVVVDYNSSPTAEGRRISFS